MSTNDTEIRNSKGERVFRYDRHMPETDDLTLIVLKGHLLIEEQLVDLASRALPHAQYLPELKFYTRACVVRAAVPHKSNNVCWELILKLNKVRNDFAHDLEPPKFQDHLRELFKIDEQVQPWPGMPIDKTGERSLDDAQRLRIVVTDCLTFLQTLGFDYQESRVPCNLPKSDKAVVTKP